MSAPSVVLCCLPADALLRFKGYSNNAVRAQAETLWAYLAQGSGGVPDFVAVAPADVAAEMSKVG